MTFGEVIKKLRREANMTQENLAELLSISPQAVSRWENGAAMPDISLLPPLANLFHVTTDYLLGMDTYQKDLRKAEFDAAFHEYWKKEDKEENYRIAVQAVAEYPRNMEYMEWLASAEFYLALPQVDEEEFKSLLESSVRHYNMILEKCKKPELYRKALNGIVSSLHMLGRNDEAKEYALRETEEEKRDELLLQCLEGAEKITLGQKVAEKALASFLLKLKMAGKSIEACDAVEKVLQVLFPDENYQYYHNILQYNAIDKARLLCKERRYDEVILELKKARFHAEETDRYNKEGKYCFTAPLFNHLKGEKIPAERGNFEVSEFILCLSNNRCFDSIRKSEEFKQLLD